MNNPIFSKIVLTIGVRIHCGQVVHPTKTSAQYSTYTAGPDSPLNQNIQPMFQQKFTRARIIANNITSNTPLC